MNEKEVAEIRRRFQPEKSNITSVRGCYVNEKREIVCEFDQSLVSMPQEEAERLLAVLKRTLSGTVGKNLMDITFSTQQVIDSPEHKLLMTLRESGLTDADAVKTFFERAIEATTMDGNYLILLAYDKYDVPYRAKDGEKLDDASSEVFSYFVCGICPVKPLKPALSYHVYENAFCASQSDWIVAPPELGFLFPAFDDRSSNIYNALYYSRDIAESHEPFVDAVFHCEVPIPAAAQKETFQTILEETLAEECCYDVVHVVHGRLCEMIEEHKASKQEQPLSVSKNTVKQMLSGCGVSEEHTEAFVQRYDDAFGAQTDLSPRNIIDVKQMEVRTPDVTIRVNPQRSNLVETRMIDGTKYILIRADENVEVNGINVNIQ